MKKYYGKSRWLGWGLMISLLLFPVGPVRADLSWEAISTTVLSAGGHEEQMGPVVRQSYSLKDNVLRIDDVDQRGIRFLNLQYSIAVVVDLNSQTFSVIPFSDLIAATIADREGMKPELAKREAELAGMEEPDRTIMAAQIAAQRKKYELWNGPFSMAPTKETATLAGHPCLKYSYMSSGSPFQDIWGATDITLAPIYQNLFAPGISRLDPQEFGFYGAVPAFPMKVISRYAGVTVTMEVTHVSTAQLALEAFLLPPGLNPAAKVVSLPQ